MHRDARIWGSSNEPKTISDVEAAAKRWGAPRSDEISGAVIPGQRTRHMLELTADRLVDGRYARPKNFPGTLKDVYDSS